jgi:hypothetical protein
MTLSVLDFVTWWPYFDPSRQDPPRLNREIFTESFWSDAPGMPGYSTANGLPDWGKDESLLTSITSWGVTRSTGVRAGYADGYKPVEGNDDGSPGSAVEISISAEDPIVSVLIASQYTDSPFTVPRFDKSVTITKRSGAQAALNQSNDPIPVRWPGQILDVAGTDSKNYYFDEHVVSSIHLNYWDGVPIPWISRQTQNVPPIAACNVVVGFRRWDSYADQQAGWRWCKNCQGLFFSLGGPRICKNGQEHVPGDGSAQYVLFLNGAPPESEPGWYWCSKCGGIFKPSRDAQFCAAGSLHSTGGSADYAMLLPVAQGSGPLPRLSTTQGGWAQCSKCCLFYFSANRPASWCPADHGKHDVESEIGHPEYVIKYT